MKARNGQDLMIWSKQNMGARTPWQLDEYSYYLRVVRKRIYEHGGCVHDDIQEYEFEVKRFLKKFENMLGREEIEIQKNKLAQTVKFAEEFLDYSMDFDDLEEIKVEEGTEDSTVSYSKSLEAENYSEALETEKYSGDLEAETYS